VTNDVYLYIKDNFGIDYSLKQVKRIIKKLEYSWVKPHPIAEDQVHNAEELLKNDTRTIDQDKDIYGLVDEVAVLKHSKCWENN
jgi:hypothetical protein